VYGSPRSGGGPAQLSARPVIETLTPIKMNNALFMFMRLDCIHLMFALLLSSERRLASNLEV
jgi:flavodoxin